jgi:ribosomal protein S12 methylthiotransferase
VKLGVLSLGCDKATVDSERLVAEFVGHGAEVTRALGDADVILVNTCGFIDAAKQESIDALLQAARMKVEGRCRAVVAVGCLVARYPEELRRDLPEVDYFHGFADLPRLVPELVRDGLLAEAEVLHPGERIFLGTAPHVRHLKISEGCDHTCAFCAIPLMRGMHRSRPLEELVREARLLEGQGAQEINLIAQDLGHYGRDVPEGPRLADLLRALLAGTSVPWYRMLYVYSAGITAELVDLLAAERRLVPYLDMPIQHAADRMLEAMRRPERQRTIRAQVARLRDTVPDIAIRTTALVGFPGETDADFRELVEFVDEVRFDGLGAFAYSAQEGTAAAALADDVPEHLKQERLGELLEIQRAISAERLEETVGREVEVLVDGPAEEGSPAPVVGRTAWQADDVDGCTYLRGDGAAAQRGTPRPGSFVRARIVEALDYDVVAEPLA